MKMVRKKELVTYTFEIAGKKGTKLQGKRTWVDSRRTWKAVVGEARKDASQGTAKEKTKAELGEAALNKARDEESKSFCVDPVIILYLETTWTLSALSVLGVHPLASEEKSLLTHLSLSLDTSCSCISMKSLAIHFPGHCKNVFQSHNRHHKWEISVVYF